MFAICRKFRRTSTLLCGGDREGPRRNCCSVFSMCVLVVVDVVIVLDVDVVDDV